MAGLNGVLALIPARSGSKGIPRKNLRDLAGSPLILWTLIPAFAASVTHLWVITDDEDIASVAQPYAGIIPEPFDLAQDDVPDAPVLRYALTYLREHTGFRPSAVVWLRPTAPFRRHEEIDDVVRLLQYSRWRYVGPRERWGSVRSVIPAPAHPWKAYIEEHGALVAAGTHRRHNHPRQGLPPAWQAIGFIDAVRTRLDPWRRSAFVLTLDRPPICPWVAPADRAVDLDTEDQWQAAEALAKRHGWTPGRVE